LTGRYQHKEYIKDLIKRGKALTKTVKTAPKPRTRALPPTPLVQAVSRQPAYFSTPDSVALPMHPRQGSTFLTPTPAPTSPATILGNSDWTYNAQFLNWTEDHKMPEGFSFPEDCEPFELDTTFLPASTYQQQEHFGAFDFTMQSSTNLFQTSLDYYDGVSSLDHLDGLAMPSMEIAPALVSTQLQQRRQYFDLSSISSTDVQDFGLELPASLYLTYALREFKILPILNLTTGGSVKTSLIKTNPMLTPGLLTTGARFRNFETGHLDDIVKQDLHNFRSRMLSTLISACNINMEKQFIIQAGLMGLYFQTLAGACKNTEAPELSFIKQLRAISALFSEQENQRTPHAEAIQPVNVAMTYWFDILGATLIRSIPLYQNNYETHLMRRQGQGLVDMMGCDDVVMYTIASIARLDAEYSQHMISGDEFVTRYKALDHDLDQLEAAQAPSWHIQLPDDAISTSNLQDNITSLFVIAARVYFSGVMPDVLRQSLYTEQVAKFVDILNYLPRGTSGYDQCLAWPFLIVGAVAASSSTFRICFTDRYQALGLLGEIGSLRVVKDILDTIWADFDDYSGTQPVRWDWRDVIATNGWNGELIV
jgi:hypothetical protein